MLCNKTGPNFLLTTCTSMIEKNAFIVTKSVSFLTPSQLHRSSEAWFTVQSNYYCKIPWLSSRTLLLHSSDGVAPLPGICSGVAQHKFLSPLCAREEDGLKPASLVFLPTSPGHAVLHRQVASLLLFCFFLPASWSWHSIPQFCYRSEPERHVKSNYLLLQGKGENEKQIQVDLSIAERWAELLEAW